jgi:hypothetical protein
MNDNKYNKELKNIENLQIFCDEVSSFINTQNIIEKGNVNKYDELQDTLRNDDLLSDIISKSNTETMRLSDSIESLESLDSSDYDRPIQSIPLLPIDLDSLYRNDNKVDMIEYYNIKEKYEKLVKEKSSKTDGMLSDYSLEDLYNKIITLKQQLSNI